MDMKALHKISYGMYIVCSKKGEKANGQIANTVFQITAEPATIAISINKQNFTHECISESKKFTVSVLTTEAPMTFIGAFGFKSGRNLDKFQNVKSMNGITGIPMVLDYTLACIEAEMISSLDCGTHTLFLGKIVDAKITDESAEPMSYAYYHTVKGGKSPKTAPTYIGEKNG